MSPRRASDEDGTLVISAAQSKTTSSRRTTCDICRERKVRCNKEHPACERCRRLKLKCSYTHQPDPLDVPRALMQLHERLQQAEAALAAARSQAPTDSSQDPNTSLGEWEMATDPFTDINNDPDFAMNFLTDASPAFAGLQPTSTTAEGIIPLAPLSAQISAYSSSENMNAMAIPSRTTSVIPGAGARGATGTGTSTSVSSSTQPTLHTHRPSTASSFSTLALHDGSLMSPEAGERGPHITTLLHQRYFEAIQTIPYVINPNRFYWMVSQHPDKHQVKALSNAVAMAGAALSEDFAHVEAFFYHAARRHIDKAEREEDGSNFQNLEIVQALLLILRFEFTETKTMARAWMTHGRAVRLLKLLSFDILDAGDALLPYRTLRLPQASPMTLADVDEVRRTFWVSFNMDFFISALTQTAPMLQVDEIYTYAPVANPSVEDPSKLFLKDILDRLSDNVGGSFSPLILATGIGNQVLQHLAMSARPQYDFWTHHFDLDKKLSECIGLSPLCRTPNALNGDKIVIMTHLTLLGVVILLHTRAYDKALQTTSSGSLLMESWQRCEIIATEISDLLSPDASFSQVGLDACKHLGMYLSWPVSLAARVQIMRLGDMTTTTRRDSKIDLTVYPMIPASPLSPQRLMAIQTSLRVLDTALHASGSSSAHFDELFKAIKTVLDSSSLPTPRKELDAPTHQKQLSSASVMEQMTGYF